MAGYMTKLQGYVYDGTHPAGEALTNGLLVALVKNATTSVMEVKKTSAALANVIFRVDEKTTLWGQPAIVMTCVSHDANEVCLVENEWDINDGDAYNTAEYSIPAGTLARIHRILPGEQMIVTVTSAVATTLAVGDQVTPAAAGTIVKKSA